MRSKRAKKSQRGLTLTELMVSLAIMAIMAAIAAPSLRDYMDEHRLRSTMSELTNDLNFARAEAIKRSARVLVCGRTSGATTCANLLDWQGGWLVCYDSDFDSQCDATSATDPNPIKIGAPLAASMTLASNTAVIRFNPVGTTSGAATFTLTGTMSGSTSRVASIAATGVVTSRKN